jgi:hypothetical protein
VILPEPPANVGTRGGRRFKPWLPIKDFVFKYDFQNKESGCFN